MRVLFEVPLRKREEASKDKPHHLRHQRLFVAYQTLNLRHLVRFRHERLCAATAVVVDKLVVTLERGGHFLIQLVNLLSRRV